MMSHSCGLPARKGGRMPRWAVPFLVFSAACIVAGVSDIQAQTTQARQISIVQEMAPVGLIFGQTLRYSRANLNDLDIVAAQAFEPVAVRYTLFAPDGSVIRQSDADAAGPGAFQYVDFPRNLIDLPGEPGTGRLQVRLQVTVFGRTTWSEIVLKRGIDRFNDSIEIIDDLTGRTVAAGGAGGGGFNEMSLDDTSGKEKSRGRGFQIISAGIDRDYLTGVVPGQILRITLGNPSDPQSAGKFLVAPLILDLDGRIIAREAGIEISARESVSFDFNYADLAGSTSATERVQVRAHVSVRLVSLEGNEPLGDPDVTASLELVDGSTGETTIMLSSKPKEIVVVGTH